MHIELTEEEIRYHVSVCQNQQSPRYLRDRSFKLLQEQFQGLIHKIVNYYKNIRKDVKDYEELYGNALLGFIKSINSFDSTRKNKFITYLHRGIRNEVIGSYRTQVKQSRVDACRYTDLATGGFSEVDHDGDLIRIHNQNCTDCELELPENLEDDLINDSLAFNFVEDLRRHGGLSVKESLTLFMREGIESNAFSFKELKECNIPNPKMHYTNAKAKLSYFIYLKEKGMI